MKNPILKLLALFMVILLMVLGFAILASITGNTQYLNYFSRFFLAIREFYFKAQTWFNDLFYSVFG